MQIKYKARQLRLWELLESSIFTAFLLSICDTGLDTKGLVFYWYSIDEVYQIMTKICEQFKDFYPKSLEIICLEDLIEYYMKSLQGSIDLFDNYSQDSQELKVSYCKKLAHNIAWQCHTFLMGLQTVWKNIDEKKEQQVKK